MSATEDKRLLERVANMEAQLKEGFGIMKAQLDRLEKSSKNSSAQLTHNVKNIIFTNFAQLLEHGSKMFQDMSGLRHVPNKATETQEIPSGEGVSSGKKRRRKKKVKRDPNCPKRPATAYFLFCADERKKLSKLEKKDQKEVLKRFGKMWREDVSKEVKDEYIKKAVLLKAQYRVDLAAYEAKKKDSTAEPNATSTDDTEPKSAPKKKKFKKQQPAAAPAANAAPIKEEEEEAASKTTPTPKKKKKRKNKNNKKKKGKKSKKSTKNKAAAASATNDTA